MDASPALAKIGGGLYAFGGWGAYEAGRRRASGEPPGLRYPGRSRIGVEDAVESLLGARASALGLAAGRLGAQLARFETAARAGAWGGAGLRLPAALPLASREAGLPPRGAAGLLELDAAAAATAAALGLDPGPPPPPPDEDFPGGEAETGDAEGVFRLEAEAAPFVAAREALEARVALRLDAAAGAVEAAAAALEAARGAI